MMQVPSSNSTVLSFFPQLFDIVLLTTAVVSTFVSLLIPCLFYLKRQCRQHPTVLIANISLLESIANFNIVLMAVDIFAYEGTVKIDQIFSLLTFGLVQIQPAIEETDFCIYNYCVYMVVELLSISFHICYAIDLLLTVKFPFFPGKKRRKYYYAFSLALLVTTFFNSLEEADEICENELTIESIYIVPVWFLVTLILFCICSMVIILVSFFGSGSRAKIRQDYIKHHRIILVLLVLMWLPPIYTNFLIRLDQLDSPWFDLANKLSFFCMIGLTGVISIVRMVFDKFLREKVKAMLRICKKDLVGTNNEGRISSLPEESQVQQRQPKEEVWNLPLSGAMNEFQSQQIVHNILQVVCEACAAHLPLKSTIRESTLRESFRSSTMLYQSVYRNTIMVEGETQVEETSFLEMLRGRGRAQHNDRMPPHEASIPQLKQLCRKKRKFNMVCHPPEQIEETSSSSDRLGQKTVHIRQNLIKGEKLREQDVNRMMSIKVTSYSHRVFQTLREYDGLTNDSLLETLSLQKNIESIKRAKESLGASGSFFFFSFDHKIVIKTISCQQKDRFIEILPFYFDHIRHNQRSLLARTYGIFSMEIAGISKIYFQMMENTFRELNHSGIQYSVYDLKGSTVQREVKDPSAPVKKDINYFRSADCFVFLSRESKVRLIDDLTKDIDMLKGHNIMDYSLLIGVGRSKKQTRNRPPPRASTLARHGSNWRCIRQLQEATRRVYSISLIDYLQEFNFSKKMQLWLKRLFKGGGDISSVDTQTYYNRFLKFVNRTVLVMDVKVESARPVFKMADSL